MMFPNLDKTKQYLQSGVSAASAVTNYAQAALTAMPALQHSPAWSAPIQSHIATLQGHATKWLQEICPAVTIGMPRRIVDFNDIFQAKSRQILDIQKAIEAGAGQPTSLQRAIVSSLLSDMASALGDHEAKVALLLTNTRSYSASVNSDQDNLAKDLGAVSARFASGHVWIQELKAALGDTFLNSSVLGPCSSIVEISLDISLKIGGVGADPSLFTLVIAKAILENQIHNSSATELAVENLLDTWTAVKLKVNAVLSDLKNARDSEYLNILSQADVETAQSQWQQLSIFASRLSPATEAAVHSLGRLELKTQAP